MPKKIDIRPLFFRRFFKYLLPLLLSFLLMLPLLAEAYRMTYEKSLQATRNNARDTLQQLDEQILSIQELSSFLLHERNFQNLLLVNGEPRPGDYIYMNQIQDQLSRLSVAKSDAVEMFLLFRDNDIYISNHISSDNFQTVYPSMLQYGEISAAQYREALMSERFSTRLFSQQDIYSRYYGRGNFSGITCVVNNSSYEFTYPSSVLVGIIDCDTILQKIWGPGEQSGDLILLSDSSGSLLMSSHYDSSVPLSQGQERISINGCEYLLVTEQSGAFGLQLTVGIPLRQFYHDLLPMVQVFLLFTLLGVTTALILSVVFSLREASSMAGLVENAAQTANTSFQGQKNEIAFVSSAIRRIGDVNAQQMERIQALHDSIRICMLENLLVMGVFTHKEEEEILRYFEQDFSFYCVLKFQCQSPPEPLGLPDGNQEQLLRLQQHLPNLFQVPPLILNLYDREFLALVFLDGESPSSLEPMKEKLTELLRAAGGGHTVHVGMSNIAAGVRNVRTAYLQSCYAVNLHAGIQRSGVYPYEAPRTRSGPVGFDLAIPFKLYDVIIGGDEKAIEQIFRETTQLVRTRQMTQQEHAQLFFTLRQAVYNAYVEASRNAASENLAETIRFPDFRADLSMEIQLEKLRSVTGSICGIIMEGRKSSALRMKTEVEAYVRGHFADPGLCAEAIADELMISEKYVFAIIKEQTGKSLGHFIEDIRIAKAEELLIQTGESNARISLLCGFGSENTFYRAFARRHGVSPSVWRKNQEEIRRL